MDKNDNLSNISMPDLMNWAVRGALTINEIRGVMGLPPIEGGEHAYVLGSDGVHLVKEFRTPQRLDTNE